MIMALISFTRPDGSPVAINPSEVVSMAPVPTTGAEGPATTGTRIVFRNQTHQDLKELFDAVLGKFNAAG